ncbi:hypothetical protein BDQ17DRAFT_1509028, partial [Cyathus striatus]
RSLTAVKSVYFFSRYFGLLCQIVNTILFFTKMYKAPTEPSLCRYWFTFQLASFNVLGSLMHGIVMLRVYALHRKDYKVGILLSLLHVAALGSGIHICLSCFRNARYDEICNLRIYVIALESIILLLTFAKMNVTTQYANIVNRVLRDGGGFFVLMIAISIVWILPSIQAIRASFANFALIGFHCTNVTGIDIHLSSERENPHNSTEKSQTWGLSGDGLKDARIWSTMLSDGNMDKMEKEKYTEHKRRTVLSD